MNIEGTYEDEFTLRAFANMFNIEIEICQHWVMMVEPLSIQKIQIR